MDRAIFESLKNCKDKIIEGDIVLKRKKKTSNMLYSSSIEVRTFYTDKIVLHIDYHLIAKRTSFNFSVKDKSSSAFCRLEINSQAHGDVGRTHKHEILTADCLNKNIPYAYNCDFLEKLTLQEQWVWLCEKALIKHEGRLYYDDDDL